jgi:hypothetical protein
VDLLTSDPQFKAGGAALTTVNQLYGLLQGLQWQLQAIPEGVRALGQVQSVVDQMIQVATQTQQFPTQMEEGLQQIFQGITAIKTQLTGMADFAIAIDTLQESVNAIAGTLPGMETAIGQIGFMLVNVGTAVPAIAHVANGGQQVEDQWHVPQQAAAAAVAAAPFHQAPTAAIGAAGSAAASSSGAASPPPPSYPPPIDDQATVADGGPWTVTDPYGTRTTTTPTMSGATTATTTRPPLPTIPEASLDSWEVLGSDPGPMI